MAETATTSAYKVFTRRFDRVVYARDLDRRLANGSALGRARLQDSWRLFVEETQAWRTAAEIHALEVSQEVRARLTAEDRSQIVVGLLVDQSGSMRGQKILLAAAAADIARSFLVNLGVKVEVLGFTTRSWHGGRSRWIWRLMGRRSHPGRLNDLLHLVYAEADDSFPGTGHRPLLHMLAPERLKENIDGEALEWAAARLLARRECRRLAVMISDGAPVDDATLLANGPTYLTDHLRAVIEDHAPKIELAQLRIGDDFESPFPTSVLAVTPDALGKDLLDLLAGMLMGLCG